MKQHQENALVIARFLESSDKVEEVTYPGLESHPQHDLAKKQSKGFGGMLSFKIKGGFEAADTFLQNIKIFTLAESLVCFFSIYLIVVLLDLITDFFFLR